MYCGSLKECWVFPLFIPDHWLVTWFFLTDLYFMNFNGYCYVIAMEEAKLEIIAFYNGISDWINGEQ